MVRLGSVTKMTSLNVSNPVQPEQARCATIAVGTIVKHKCTGFPSGEGFDRWQLYEFLTSINTSAQGSHGLGVSMRSGLYLIPTNSSWGLNPL